MKTRLLWLALPWALFLALAGGWMFYWNAAAGTAEQRLREFVAAQNASGAQASIARIERRGFPVLLRLELHNIAYAPARGDWRASSERIDLHVDLLKPQHVIFKAETPIAFARADGAVTNLAAEGLIASLRTEGGALAVAGLQADRLTLDDPAAEGVLSAEKIVFNLRPDARKAGDYQLSLDANALNLPRPVRSFESFGTSIASLRAGIVVEHGAALTTGAPGDPLRPWREAGGRLRFEALELNWGPVQASGAGWGGLDAERRITGALTLPIERPAQIFAALAKGPRVSEDARRALGLLAASFALSGEDITLDVEAAAGALRLEGLTVRTLGPVY
jgi:hypothetical protein